METFEIHSRFFEGEGWKHTVQTVTCEYREAGRLASQVAQALDNVYGDDHFWTVDIKSSDGMGYYQFFHGRTS